MTANLPTSASGWILLVSWSCRKSIRLRSCTRCWNHPRELSVSCFTSETIQPIGENAWDVSRNLQLHGQTRVIHLSAHKMDRRYIGSINDQTDRLWLSTDQYPRRRSKGRERIQDRFRDRYQIESSGALLAHGDEPNPQHAHDEDISGMRVWLTRSSEPSE